MVIQRAHNRKFKTIKDIPIKIKNSDFPDDIEIRGEFLLKKIS